MTTLRLRAGTAVSGMALACLLTCTATTATPMKLIETAKGTSVYVDPDVIDKSTDQRKVVELWNYTQPDQFGDFSSVLETEYECSTKSRRLIRVTGYEAQMGQGKKTGVRENPDKEWHPIPSGQLMEAVFRGVCLK